MKIARKHPDHPDRTLELEESTDATVVEVIAEANDAGYGTEDAREALDEVFENQRLVYAENPDPADDPEIERELERLRRIA